MEYDYYKLYLADDFGYTDRIICISLEQVQLEINKAVGYTKYLVVAHSVELNMDDPIAQGTFNVNQQNMPLRTRNI